jgi:hypothetical protein
MTADIFSFEEGVVRLVETRKDSERLDRSGYWRIQEQGPEGECDNVSDCGDDNRIGQPQSDVWFPEVVLDGLSNEADRRNGEPQSKQIDSDNANSDSQSER